MRFESISIGGNLHAAVDYVNMHNVAHNVHSFHGFSSGTIALVIFKFEDYPSYVHWCKKMRREPLPTKEFFA